MSGAFSVTLKLPYPPRVTVLKGEYDPSANVVELEWEEPDYDLYKGFFKCIENLSQKEDGLVLFKINQELMKTVLLTAMSKKAKLIIIRLL